METERKGIVLAGGAGTRLYPVTRTVSKQLLPVYDKPMIYYPISVLMLMGIREILVISTPEDLPQFERLLGNGKDFGVDFEFVVQPAPAGLAQALVLGEGFLDGMPSCLILGDNFFHGGMLGERLRRISADPGGATIFGYRVSNPQAYGVVEIGADGEPLSMEEKPAKPRSHFAIPGMYFYDGRAPEWAASLRPSPRGELEITDLNRKYMESGALRVELLGRGTAWLDMGTHDDLLEASNFVQAIQHRQGLQIACLEEIALSQGWITSAQIEARISRMGRTRYAEYLRERLRE